MGGARGRRKYSGQIMDHVANVYILSSWLNPAARGPRRHRVYQNLAIYFCR